LGGDLSVSCVYGFPGTGCGVVYKLDPKGKETVLYAFTGGADGGTLDGFSPTLVRDEAGNLYGTMGTGGDLSACGGLGCGLVYRFIDFYPLSRPCVMLSHGQQIETGETALDLGGSQLA